MNAKDSPHLLSTALSLALAGGCSSTSTADAPSLELASCSEADSPGELLRVAANPEDVFVEAFDLGEAVSVKFDGYRGDPRFSLLDNCGGSPIRLRETFELPTGAAAVGGDIVLCGGGFGAPSGPPADSPHGVWQLLEDGSAGEDLALGHSCTADVSTRLPSFGIVFADEDVVTQHLPDGAQRVISNGAGFEMITTAHGAGVFSFGTPTTIHPADGSTPIEVEFPETPRYVVQQGGRPVTSDWLLAIPHDRPGDLDPEVHIAAYAVEVNTGAWFQTPAISLRSLETSGFSLREGLLAAYSEDDEDNDGLMLARSSWDAGLFFDYRRLSGYAVVDDERVLLIDPEGFRVVRIPLEYPTSGPWFEPEVVGSYPWEDDRPGFGSGVAWNDLVLVNRSVDNYIWAYPIDGRDPFPFVPISTLLHFGDESVTGVGFHPDDTQRVSLYQRRYDSDLDVIADDLLSGRNDGQRGVSRLAHAWTPELGRILYAVQEGDDISVRQHRLED